MVKIKVVHVIEASLGGTRRYLEDMVYSGALDNYECSLVFSTRRSDPQFYKLLDEFGRRNWKLFNVGMKREVDPISDIKSIYSIRRLILELSPDILHCHSSKGGALGRIAAILIPRRIRPAVIYTPNALAIHLGKQYIFAEKILAGITDLFVSISESEGREIAQYTKISPGKIHTVWPSIASTYYSPMNQDISRKILNIDQTTKLIVAIGRITEQKDPILFLEIYKQLKKEYPFLQAIWVGDGNLRRRMEEFKQNHGIEGFFITGWVNDVRPFIAAANVVVVPSQYESFGYVSAESLAMERAVAATSVNGSIDIIEDGITGYLFLPGDISEGVKKIGNLLVNEDIAVEMAKNGRKKVLNKFTSELMCYNLEQAYNKALKSTVESREYA